MSKTIELVDMEGMMASCCIIHRPFFDIADLDGCIDPVSHRTLGR
jgi:hypothetical protein